MQPPKAQQSIEHDIRALAQSLDKHVSDGAHVIPELVPDLTKAVHGIGDHLVALHRRLERLEAAENEWTTRGWEPPPGANRSAGEAG